MNRTFTVPARALAEAVKFAAHWINPRPAIPAHGGLLFEVDGDRLNLFGFNEGGIARATVAIDADDEPTGGFIVSGRLMGQLATTFADKPVKFAHIDNTVHVTAGSWRGTLPAMSDKEFPALAGAAPTVGYVNGAEMADAVARVGTGAGRDPEKGVHLTGMRVEFGDNTLTFYATDRYRAVRQIITWEREDGESLGQSALPPAGALVDAMSAFNITIGSVTLGWQPGTFSLTSEARSLVLTELAEVDKFPRVGPMFDSEFPQAARFSAKDLALPMKRAGILRGGETDAVVLDVREDLLVLSVAAGDSAQGGEEEISISYAGEPAVLRFDAKRLHDGIVSAPGDLVDLRFTPTPEGGKPKHAMLTSDADPTWAHIVMPLVPVGGGK